MCRLRRLQRYSKVLSGDPAGVSLMRSMTNWQRTNLLQRSNNHRLNICSEGRSLRGNWDNTYWTLSRKWTSDWWSPSGEATWNNSTPLITPPNALSKSNSRITMLSNGRPRSPMPRVTVSSMQAWIQGPKKPSKESPRVNQEHNILSNLGKPSEWIFKAWMSWGVNALNALRSHVWRWASGDLSSAVNMGKTTFFHWRIDPALCGNGENLIAATSFQCKHVSSRLPSSTTVSWSTGSRSLSLGEAQKGLSDP